MSCYYTIIILVIVIAILAVAVCLAFVSNNSKEDSMVIILANGTVSEGDSLNIKLLDFNATPIANQTVNVTFSNGEGTHGYSALTNQYGFATIDLDLSQGNYTLNATYAGNDRFASNSSVIQISVLKEVKQAESSTLANDPGAFYSAQAGRVIYTGEVQYAPDNHHWKHLGNNEWVKID